MPITTLDMRVLETNSIALGIPLRLLMEAAGKSVADYILSSVPLDRDSAVLVLAGKGGNGGDGLVAARYLARCGFRVEVLPAYSHREIEHPDTMYNFKLISSLPTITIHEPGDLSKIRDVDVVVDALLGTGVRGELKDPIRSIVERANSVKAKLKVAVDTPSGLNPDTGEVHGVAFRADVTITFHDVKPGLVNRAEYTGKVVVANIGIPLEAEIYVGPGDLVHRLPKRPRDAHKGMAGKVLIVGGSYRYTGAAGLTALSALASGADLAYLVVPEAIRSVVASYSPEIITLTYEGSRLSASSLSAVESYVDAFKPHVVVVGPGLGDDPETLEAVEALLEIVIGKGLYLVIDADALKAVRLGKSRFDGRAVLTPHRGEYKRITGAELRGDIKSVGEEVRKAAESMRATILLKAPVDVISDGSRVRFNRTGNPYMTIGGTGDVLTGLTATFLAQARDPFTAACIAAYVNGLAGDYLHKSNRGVSPLKIIEVVPTILRRALEVHVETYLEGELRKSVELS